MKGNKAVQGIPGTSGRATLTLLPEGMLEMVVKKLDLNDKHRLALCCKAMLPVLTMGSSFDLWLDNPDCKGPLLLQFSRCLAKHPSRDFRLCLSYFNHKRYNKYELWELSLLAKLRDLRLWDLAFPLPALQQVATRLRALDITACCLQGSADGFLTVGWTALTSLSLDSFTNAEDNMCSALQLPALELERICEFRHQGGLLQLSQLCGSCLQIRRQELECSLARPSEASEQQGSLLNLSRLADLDIMDTSLRADLDLDLPASLTRLELQGSQHDNQFCMDFFWVLLQAIKGIRQGAHLHTLFIRMTEASLQPARWGATLEEQFRHLGGQLNGLKVLEVFGRGDPLLSALSAVASSAPSLTRLVCNDCDKLPATSSASLKSITSG